MMQESTLVSHINNLQASIQWAQFEDDLNVLHLAKNHMDELMTFITTLPEPQQQTAYINVDKLLPMEWPMWMEACRYSDSAVFADQAMVLH